MKKRKFESIEEAATAIYRGLNTDGAHHKQYYLATALRHLVGDEIADKWQMEDEWDNGVAP